MTKDFFFALFSEADSYKSLESIEEMLDTNRDLSNIPIQPLYMVFKNQVPEKAAEWLPKLSSEQRQLFLDLDLWLRDEIDVQSFTYWITAYVNTPSEEVKKEFLTSESFTLFLKGRFNIWTFDSEDPEYPEHDNYFLTDDTLLLFEYEESFEYVEEVRTLIRDLYSLVGVEQAYSHLFKVVSDTYSIAQEEEYRIKKERLRDVGMVDYFEAIELETPFANVTMLDHFIKSKKRFDAKLDNFAKNQSLHSSALLPYREKMNDFSKEMLMISNENRSDYLRFNFVRLVNATLASTGALKEGTLAVNRTGQKARNYLQLGLCYLNEISRVKGDLILESNESVLEVFDYTEIYRIGLSLIRFLQKDLKKKLSEFKFESDNEAFLGNYWNEFSDHFLDAPAKIVSPTDLKAYEITNLEQLSIADINIETFKSLAPFIYQMSTRLSELKSTGRLQDSFYLNYTVEEIDFEAILISSFANYFLGQIHENSAEKLGLTVAEFRKFGQWLIDGEGQLKKDKKIEDKMTEFFVHFGLNHVSNINIYFKNILSRQLEGYDYEDLLDDEFKHVGGPIILNNLVQ